MKKLEVKDLKENFSKRLEKSGCWLQPEQKRSLTR